MRPPAVVAALALLGASCAPPARVATSSRVAEIAYHEREWNVGGAAKGPVRAVLDGGDEVVVLGDGSATIFAEGALVGGDRHEAGWIGAATIPAPDRSGEWLVALDATGKMFHLRARKGFEPISARFGLGASQVGAASATGGPSAVFATKDGFALSNGEKVTFYRGTTPSLVAGGGHRAVLASRDAVTVVSSKDASAVVYPLRARAVAVDDDGRVAIATSNAVYLGTETGPELSLVYAGDDVHGLARSGKRLFFADGRRLYVLAQGVVKAAAGVSVREDATLVGSPTGDVWALAGGSLVRLTEGAPAGRGEPTDAPTFARDIGPLVGRACAPCHAEGGATGIVLTAEEGLHARRDLVRQRVLVDRDMPPPSRPLSPADRALLERWLAGGAK